MPPPGDRAKLASSDDRAVAAREAKLPWQKSHTDAYPRLRIVLCLVMHCEMTDPRDASGWASTQRSVAEFLVRFGEQMAQIEPVAA